MSDKNILEYFLRSDIFILFTMIDNTKLLIYEGRYIIYEEIPETETIRFTCEEMPTLIARSSKLFKQ